MINLIIMLVAVNNQTKTLKMSRLVRRAYLLRSLDVQFPFFIIFLVMIGPIYNLGMIALLIIVALIARWFDLYRLDVHFNETHVNALYLYSGRKRLALVIEALTIIAILFSHYLLYLIN